MNMFKAIFTASLLSILAVLPATCQVIEQQTSGNAGQSENVDCMPDGYRVSPGELEKYQKDGAKGIGTHRFLFLLKEDDPRLRLLSFRKENDIADLAVDSILVYNEYLAHKINDDVALSRFDLQLLDIVIRSNYLYIKGVCRAMLFSATGMDVSEVDSESLGGKQKDVGFFESLGRVCDAIARGASAPTNMVNELMVRGGDSGETESEDYGMFCAADNIHKMDRLSMNWTQSAKKEVMFAKLIGGLLAENTFTMEPGFVLGLLTSNVAVDMDRPRCDGISDALICRHGRAEAVIHTLVQAVAVLSAITGGKTKDKGEVERTIPFDFKPEQFNVAWREIDDTVFRSSFRFLTRVNAEVNAQLAYSTDREGFGGLRSMISVWRPRLRVLGKTYRYVFYDYPVAIITKSAYDAVKSCSGFWHTDKEGIATIAYQYNVCLCQGRMTKFVQSHTAADVFLKFHAYLKKALGPDDYKRCYQALQKAGRDELRAMEFENHVPVPVQRKTVVAPTAVASTDVAPVSAAPASDTSKVTRRDDNSKKSANGASRGVAPWFFGFLSGIVLVVIVVLLGKR